MTLFDKTCPHCGQPMKGVFDGVYLTPGRFRVLEAIRTSPGITMDRLAVKLYKSDSNASRRTVASTITAINDRLEETDWKIIGPRIHHAGGYHLIKRSEWNSMWSKPYDWPVDKDQKEEQVRK